MGMDPPQTAQCKQLTPFFVTAARSAPAASRSLATSRWPLRQAHMRGVRPSLLLRSTSAPVSSTRYLTRRHSAVATASNESAAAPSATGQRYGLGWMAVFPWRNEALHGPCRARTAPPQGGRRLPPTAAPSGRACPPRHRGAIRQQNQPAFGGQPDRRFGPWPVQT